MIVVKINVIEFAIITGASLIRMPYINQKNIPRVNARYIPNDRSLVCFVLIVLIAWGRNESVVKAAAINPT